MSLSSSQKRYSGRPMLEHVQRRKRLKSICRKLDESSSMGSSGTADQAHACSGPCGGVLRKCCCGTWMCGCGTQGACAKCHLQDECRNCSWGRDHGTACFKCARFFHWNCLYERCELDPCHRFCKECSERCRICSGTICFVCGTNCDCLGEKAEPE